jgi:solute carrier family 35 protein F1/2
MLCLSGASLYALSNTIQEKFIQTWSSSEYLFILGLFGTLISFSQWYFIELNPVLNTQFTTLSLSLILLCTLGLVLFYSLTPTLITNTSATFFNISLLTSDFWSLLVGLILFDLKVPNVYPISFILVIYGLYLFNITKSRAVRTSWYSWPEVNGSSENLAGLLAGSNNQEGYEAIP